MNIGTNPNRCDERIQTTIVHAEASTQDLVPLHAAATVLWHLHDAQKVMLTIADCRPAIEQAAQASLHETIGASMLAALLCDRRAADRQLRADIARRSVDWGVVVRAVEIREIAVSPARQAEDDARLVLQLGLRLIRHRARASEANIATHIVQR